MFFKAWYLVTRLYFSLILLFKFSFILLLEMIIKFEIISLKNLLVIPFDNILSLELYIGNKPDLTFFLKFLSKSNSG